MGLTIHYRMRCNARLAPEKAEALVQAVHRRAAALVRRRGLAEISPVRPADPKHPSACQFVLEKISENESRGHDVRPECGWMFRVLPGKGCESATFGLALYPETIRVGRRTLATECGGWGWSDFCKTQYASLHGAEHFLKCHRAVIDLLRLWERRDMAVSINDEGGYWPGRDEARLLEEVDGMNRLLAAFGGALKDAADEVGSKVESPIFAHGHFELLEAEGLSQHAPRIAAAVKAVTRIGPGEARL